MNRSTFVPALVLALGLVGCGDRGARVDRQVGPFDVATITDHLVYVDHGRSEAILLDLSSGPPGAPSVVPVVPNPVRVERRLGNPDQLLILSAGIPDEAGAENPQKPGLTVLEASGKTRTFRFDGAFDSLTQSPDGRYALLSFSSQASSGSLLFNALEIAVVDLESESDPRVLTLRNLGSGAIRSILFSPKDFSIGGLPRRLAVVLFDSYFAIVDLEQMFVSSPYAEYSVELLGATAAGGRLAQVEFSTGSTSDGRLYLRADGSDDVYVVQLSEKASTPSSPNPFLPSINTQFVGGRPTDIALFSDQAGALELLVAAPSARSAFVVDSALRVTTQPLPDDAHRVLVYSGPKPGDPTVEARAVAYSEQSSTVTFLDVEHLGDPTGRGVETLQLAQQFTAPVPLDDDTVMLPHVTTGLSLLRLADRTVSEISGPNLGGAVPDVVRRDDGSIVSDKIWLAHGDKLGFLDLTRSFLPSELRVDAPIQQTLTVPGNAPKVVVTHEDALGWITVLDAADPSLDTAYSVRGFLVNDLLVGGGP
ncbi:MAG TPA: hypothetical protein VHE30_14535 [Polyangiaceae bacterium]|nr:hypothetical protein [Polyangiaceae bacterium]